MKATAIKRAPTLFLKAVLVCIAIVTLIICAFFFPYVYAELLAGLPEFAPVIYPGLIGLYLSPIPFIFALYQAFKLLHYIDKNNAFSPLSEQALKLIKYSGIAMSISYAACMPLIFVLAEIDDAPGGIVIGAAIAAAPSVVATFAAVLQKLVRSAINLKEENDLTV